MHDAVRKSSPNDPSAGELFRGGGEMGELIRAKDWSRTPLGPAEGWPQSLRTAIRIILLSRYPMFVWWGKDLINFYNDQYVPILGKKHPASLGQSGQESWREIWDQVGPRAEAVFQRGEATFDEGLLLMMDRFGYLEETYFTFSYSPLPDDQGRIGGLFCVVTEDTDRVIGERRLRLLRKLATATTESKTTEAVCLRAAECLLESNRDLPFTLIYLSDPGSRTLRLACASGISISHPAAPETIMTDTPQVWPAMEVLASGQPVVVDDLSSRIPHLPSGAWSDPPRCAILVPLAQPGKGEPAGVLIAAFNPHRQLDEEFKGFVGLVAAQIAAALGNANSYEAERKRAEALAELDRAKTTFFSNVSHEFRTPLTLMLGPTEEALGTPQRSLGGADLERVHRNELRLLKLVNTLLDFTRLESGRIHATYRATDLASLTKGVARIFRSAMERAGLWFKVKCPPLKNAVYVDREMWEKIVLNLLSNALKSTFDGGVTVTLREQKDHAELCIQDSGTGIPEQEVPHLFERFRRIENARRRTHEGSGIGLALVHELVRLHGGNIEVKSVVDRGSTFTVSIPLGKSHLPADAVYDGDAPATASISRTAFIEEALSWLPNDGAPEPVEVPLVPETLSSKQESDITGRVLLVDDNQDMRHYVAKLLSGMFEVVTAENGRVALEKALRDPPDIVLTDVMMPEMDGFELLAALRKQPETSTIPVIMVSARAGEEARVEGMGAAADDYLTKPFSARELLARVQAHLKIARFRKQTVEHEMQLEAELEEARRLAAEAVENISDGFFALDSQWRFTYVNQEAGRIAAEAGAGAEVLGSTLWQVFPYLAGTDIEQSYLRCMNQRIPVQFEAMFQRRWYSVRAYPAPRGGMVIYAVDITSRKSAETALRMKQEHLLLTQKAAKIGTWELVEDEDLSVSPEFAEILGLPTYVSHIKYADFLRAFFLSGDRMRVEEVLQRALRNSREFSTELRLKHSDGSARLVSFRGKGFYNQGKPVVLGVLVDISGGELQSRSAEDLKPPRKNKKETA